jgi:hypothetical protein
MNGIVRASGFKTHADDRRPIVLGAVPRLANKLCRIQTPAFPLVGAAEADAAAGMAALDQTCGLATPITKL